MKKETRPWGWFVVLFDNMRIWVKVLFVRGRTSLQYHQFRTELHIGTGGVRLVRPYERHRVTRGVWLEIAWGSVYEWDIFREKDDYGRAIME